MDSDVEEEANLNDTPEEWRRRLTVKVEYANEEENAPTAGSNTYGADSPEDISIRKHKSGKKSRKAVVKTGRGDHGSGKAPKEERILAPKEDIVYTPALALSQLPFGSSQVVKATKNDLSAEQLLLMDMARNGATGLWRMHAKSGVTYRKGPFTKEERMIMEEALKQYAQREGLGSVEEAVRSLSGNRGRKNCGRFHAIAKCLPERPFISVYGYIRRHICGKTKRGRWTEKEAKQLVELVEHYPESVRGRWVKIGAVMSRRPADVCDKWRGLKPRIRQMEGTLANSQSDANAKPNASIPVLEYNPQSDGEQATPGEASGCTEDVAKTAKVDCLNDEQKQLLLQQVQAKTGEDLASFGIPWKVIQEESFPNCGHSFLRRIFCLAMFPAELEKRMGTKPRPVIMRHVLRCLQRLRELPPQLRGVEWLEILPFVPAILQRDVLRCAAAPFLKKGDTLDAAIPKLVKRHADRLETMRKKDASRMLRAALPVKVQEALKAQVEAKAAMKGWRTSAQKRKLRKQIRKAAAAEVNRLKARLSNIRAAPLNTPPKGKGLQALTHGNCGSDGLGYSSISKGDLDAETAKFLATPFTHGGDIVSMTLQPANKPSQPLALSGHVQGSTSDNANAADIQHSSEAAGSTAETEQRSPLISDSGADGERIRSKKRRRRKHALEET